MEINTSFNPPPLQPARTNNKAAAGTAQVSQEQVSLSEAAQLKSAESPVNSSRVAEIRQAIAEGRFKTNPEAIADRLISLSQELVNTQSQMGTVK